ncbi:hypothetical protein Kpol_1013p19 [Vanderwaltozyma polyspora DSM 70294]|uniref:Mitochondrial inner membrane protease subunit 2 n=1 Tax=Vanderwaltozyma polyspora (strain ATCC 22028 / DSM 70294 / BCRC 21397 / CBS 2163 / NBRC 10782 / NRRL Y-8283 / UCD 57-17) TaxID=436907 RepID=A7TH67_VANPO|nr:uncharacterized protein Kpol_1013p19 [Vanderwaltozyma polyspora DSM 70294]EDO18348.1 hypothetical protein Kpol_1013p19 [Vanderwaltozyma polyspora DSM 70294]
MAKVNSFKIAFITLSWIPVMMTFNNNVCYVANIKGSSMRPTLNPNDNEISNDWVLLWKFGCQKSYNLHRDDIILFKAPSDPSTVYCKRIKGIQYDTIKTKAPYPRETVTIPRNHLWVEGDNVFHSIDSNKFGPISSGLVIGKAVKVIWPPSRWGTDLKESLGRGNVVTINPDLS